MGYYKQATVEVSLKQDSYKQTEVYVSLKLGGCKQATVEVYAKLDGGKQAAAGDSFCHFCLWRVRFASARFTPKK